jgi:hypothetical protein
MGTTVTTNLGLIKPDTDEKIKEDLPTFDGWAAQNGVNMDAIDELFRDDTATYVLNWTADAVNPTLGAGGFAEGKFIRLWPRMVLVYFRLYAGTAGFNPGSGVFKFNLPTGVAPDFSTVDDAIPIGKAVFHDNSAALTSSNFLVVYTPPTDRFFMRLSQGGNFSGAAPVTMANEDRVSGYCIYPTADA